MVPNLNGFDGDEPQRFLRGAEASGGTGGTDVHDHLLGGSAAPAGGISYDEGTTYLGSTTNTSTLPSYYEVVWIMRVK